MSENYALQLRHITKTFPGVKALDDVSFVVGNGETKAIHSPQAAKSLGISMIFQELVYVPNLSVAENLCLGNLPVTKAGLVDWKSMREEARKILNIEEIHATPTSMMHTLSISDDGDRQGDLPQREDRDHGRAHLVPHAARIRAPV